MPCSPPPLLTQILIFIWNLCWFSKNILIHMLIKGHRIYFNRRIFTSLSNLIHFNVNTHDGNMKVIYRLLIKFSITKNENFWNMWKYIEIFSNLILIYWLIQQNMYLITSHDIGLMKILIYSRYSLTRFKKMMKGEVLSIFLSYLNYWGTHPYISHFLLFNISSS